MRGDVTFLYEIVLNPVTNFEGKARGTVTTLHKFCNAATAPLDSTIKIVTCNGHVSIDP